MDMLSMVQRTGDTLIVRSPVSGDQIFLDQQTRKVIKSLPNNSGGHQQQQQQHDQYHQSPSLSLDGLPADMIDDLESGVGNGGHTTLGSKDEGLPQCKIKRNYSCNSCTFFTQNPRYFLTHLRDVHGEKIVINECKLCLYASRHYQKLVRHMKMVHGSTEGIEDHAHARKRQLGREGRKRKIIIENHPTPPPPAPVPTPVNVSPVHHQHHHHQMITASSSPRKFDDHLSMVADDAPQNRLLKCSLCDFTTLYRAQLVEHEQDEHCKTKFFRCEKCTYVTHIKARFSKHVKYHSMPMIKCVTCDFRTPYKWNLDRHMKNHGGTGPFKCAACNFTADIKQSLTVHEMNHHVPPVGHAAGMSMARRKNKVGGTDTTEDFLSENGDLEDSNNNNNIDDFDETMSKRYKYSDEDQPTDLSQKSNLEITHQQQKKAVRPIPNLIPISAAGNALNLSKNLSAAIQKEISNDKTSLTELASLFFSTNKLPEILTTSGGAEMSQLSPSSNSSTTSKRKGANLFNRLKETLAIDAARNENLLCACGHTSKCLSELILHRNTCQKAETEEKRSSPSPINLSVNSGSTRCQFCRHRCKSSADLISHIKNCIEAGHCPNDSYDSLSEDINERHEDDGADESIAEVMSNNKHPMENRIFVWNKLPIVKNETGSTGGYIGDQENVQGDMEDEKKPMLMQCSGENGYYGVETAPGYGEVTKKMTSEEEAANSSLKKVYKCPHCAFWASTASRFHVHIVGHLNKKPFECSFCAYRSNWRWDITKHIRLKTIRDPNHKIARVLMNDETGRRNYTKYNKYITLMKVTEEDGDPKLLKSGEMTPHQEASLALLNEYNNGMQRNKATIDIHNNEGLENKQNGTGSSLNNNSNNNNNNNNNGNVGVIGSGGGGGGDVDPNRFIRLPFLTPAMIGMIPSQQHIPSQHQQEHQEISGSKRSPPMLIKPADDLVTQNIDLKPDGSEKKTLYKCRKCNYRNANRDMVLSHVKGHYQHLSTPLQVAVNSNIYMNNVFAAMCLSQSLNAGGDKTGKQQHPLLANSLLQPPVQPPPLPPQSSSIVSSTAALQHQQQQQQQSINPTTFSGSNPIKNNNNNNSTTLLPLNLGLPTGTSSSSTAAKSIMIEHGETDEASSVGVVTTSGTGTGVTGWRSPAPYRCGHCHQVSNWKHVIQRHCRLKHNSDIRIETVDRNSNKNSPIYHPLIVPPQSSSSGNIPNGNINNNGPIGGGSCTSSTAASIQNHKMNNCTNNNNNINNNNNQEISTKSHAPISTTTTTTTTYEHYLQNNNNSGGGDKLLMNSIMESMILGGSKDISTTSKLSSEFMESSSSTAVIDKAKSRQQLCPSCPFVSESKSQMNYHISMLHRNKPEIYECQLCSYTTSKKQQLNQHHKMFHSEIDQIENGGEAATAIDLRAKNVIIVEDSDLSSCDGVILFCQNCPARFIGMKELNLHTKMHGANLSYQCKRCDYSSRQEHDLRAHHLVHTVMYQEKTEKLCFKFKISTEHPRPTVSKLSQNDHKGSEDIWIVDRIIKDAISSSTNDHHENSFHMHTNRVDHDNGNDDDGSIKSNPIVEQNSNCRSLLKAQLESGEHSKPPPPPSSASLNEKNSTTEKCLDCPFETEIRSDYKEHIQCHERISGRTEKFRCFACDFSVTAEEHLKAHTKLHLLPIVNAKHVDFYTSYKNLELNIVNSMEKSIGDNSKEAKSVTTTATTTTTTTENVYKSDNEKGDTLEDNCCNNNDDDDEDNDCINSGHKIILDATTGEIIRKYNGNEPSSSSSLSSSLSPSSSTSLIVSPSRSGGGGGGNGGDEDHDDRKISDSNNIQDNDNGVGCGGNGNGEGSSS